jgi:hypothetical protein
MNWPDYLSGFILGFGIGCWLYNWSFRAGVRQTEREHGVEEKE